MRRLIIVLSLMLISTSMIGCLAQDTNGKWHVALSKEAADNIENAADVGTSVLSLMSIFVPGLAGVAGAAAAGTATYKKMKPSLIRNKAVSQHVVKSIETIKKQNPELWGKMKTYMAEDCNTDVDTAIKEMVNVIKQVERRD